MRVDIFDVDHTIVHCSTVKAFILRGLKEGLIGLSIGFYAPYLFVRYGRSGFSGFDAGRAFPFLARVSVAELDKLARRLLDERFLPSLDDAVLRRIELSRRAGRRAVIASSSFSIILRPLAEKLGIEDIVANELELEEGWTTGRLVGEPVYGLGKKTRVLGRLAAIGAEPRECSFYTDSYRDRPLLEAVGHPVAVNPSRSLRRAARVLGWEILETDSSRKRGEACSTC